MQADNTEALWVEKFRPHKVSDCILPKSLLDIFSGMVEKGEVQNMILSGPSGSGKTTIAQALCEELNSNFILINGSEENGIDMLRTKLRNFATTVSFNGGIKVAIIDEADKLTPTAQPAFRRFMEEFSKNCRFIFTCNNKSQIIQAIHSRAPVIDFVIEASDRPKMASKFLKRTKEILEAEGVTYDEKVLVQLLTKFFPDYRRVIGELNLYSRRGNIDVGILSMLADANLKPLIDALKEKDFKKMRAWVANNEVDPTFFRKLFDETWEKVDNVPALVIMMNDYQYKAAFVADQELNTTACLVEFMATENFK